MRGGRGGKNEKSMKKKPPLLAESTQGLITTKQTKTRPVASAGSKATTQIKHRACVGVELK